MPNHRAFTSGFVSGLLGQRDADPIEAARISRMEAQIRRHMSVANAMPHIRMYVSPWFIDADGLWTRRVHQIERRRDVPG